MILQTYQSKTVLRILNSGEIYRAKPNLMLQGEYSALIDLLGLTCECPIFAVVKGKKQNTGGKVSGSVRLTLDVPDKFVHFTEYEEWADFLYAFKFTKPGKYKVLKADCEEINARTYSELLQSLKRQKKPSQYKCPQAILEKINPAWIQSTKVMVRSSFLGRFFGQGK